MAKLIGSDLDFNNASRITNLPNAVADQQPVTLIQLNNAVEGLKQKDPVRVAAASNVNLASPGATVDGVTLQTGNRFLARGQTDNTQNGIYIFNGAASPATRSLDASTAAELNNALVPVAEGSDENLVYRQTATIVTLESDPVTFANFGTSVPDASETISGKIELATQAETDAGTDDLRAVTPLKFATSVFAKKKFTQNIGDGSATQYTVTHNLNTLDVVVEVFRNSGTNDSILCDVERTSANAVRLTFAVAPSSNQFRTVVIA